MTQQKYTKFENQKHGGGEFFFNSDNSPPPLTNTVVEEAKPVFISDARLKPMGEALTRTCPEITDPVKCEIQGKLPEWLSGSFIRLGPGKFEWGDTEYKHCFDGDSLVHKFEVKDGNIFYSNRFLESSYHKKNAKYNKISNLGFGTWAPPDPCANIFKRMFLYFMPSNANDNANVKPLNVKDGDIWAASETPWMLQLDKETLRTIRESNAMEGVNRDGQGWLAHPHVDSDGNLYNFSVKQKPTCHYDLVRIPMRPQATTEEPFKGIQVVGSLPASQSLPAYYHSFGMTEKYFILIENPFYIKSVFAVLTMNMFKNAFLDILKWKPEYGTIIRVLDKRTGLELRKTKVSPVFIFHHVNAFERDGEIIIDVSAYKDASIVKALYMRNLRDGHEGEWLNPPNLLRYRLPVKELLDPTDAALELPTDAMGHDYECLAANFEMPTLNYEAVNGKPYRYTYGADPTFGKYLFKVDVTTKTTMKWTPGDNYSVSEGYFIAAPGSKREDDGVVVSVVTGYNGNSSLMVVLNAGSFQEIARAVLPVSPPMSIHGTFFGN